MDFLNTLNLKSKGIFNVNIGLLILRIFLGLAMFSKHGAEKVFTFDMMQRTFPDPIGIGSTTGLIFALITDSICSLMVATGIYTRFSAFLLTFNLLVVFTFLHNFSFQDGHAELVFIYLGGYLSIFIAGPGKYSLDYYITKRSQ